MHLGLSCCGRLGKPGMLEPADTCCLLTLHFAATLTHLLTPDALSYLTNYWLLSLPTGSTAHYHQWLSSALVYGSQAQGLAYCDIYHTREGSMEGMQTCTLHALVATATSTA